MNDKPMLTRDAQGNCQIYFTFEHMKKWAKLGAIPKHLLDHFHRSFERSKNITNPADIQSILTEEETSKFREEAQMQVELHHFLIDNWDALCSALAEKGLFRDVRHEENFGVARLETDCVYYLPDLLDRMKAVQVSEADYLARGEIKNSKGLTIALEFELGAKNQRQADEIVNKFKKMMVTKGLRAFLAFWKTANEKGGLTFGCSISEVMGQISEEGRIAHFSDKERVDFWTITRTLAATRFMIEWPAKPSPGRRRKDRTGLGWVEQPLLQIHGGHKEKCPTKIIVTVLTKESANQRFAPAIFMNATLGLHPSDVNLAVVIQSRAAQMKNGEREIRLGWPSTYRAANLGKTAKSNPRVAKNLVRKKMRHYKEKSIVRDWHEGEGLLHITPTESKK